MTNNRGILGSSREEAIQECLRLADAFGRARRRWVLDADVTPNDTQAARAALESAIRALAAQPAPQRLVYRHGDPETGDQGEPGIEQPDGSVAWFDGAQPAVVVPAEPFEALPALQAAKVVLDSVYLALKAADGIPAWSSGVPVWDLINARSLVNSALTHPDPLPYGITMDEVRAILKWPDALRLIADLHDVKETEADAIGEMDECVKHHEERRKFFTAEAKRIEDAY